MCFTLTVPKLKSAFFSITKSKTKVNQKHYKLEKRTNNQSAIYNLTTRTTCSYKHLLLAYYNTGL